MDDKKKVVQKEEWTFQVDQDQIRDLERKREEKRLEELRSNKIRERKKILIEEIKEDTNSKSDLRKELDAKHISDEKRQNQERERAVLAPYLQRLAAYLLDIILIGLLLLAFFKASATLMLFKQVKIYSGVDVISLTRQLLILEAPNSLKPKDDLQAKKEASPEPSDARVEFRKTELDFIHDRPDFTKTTSQLEGYRVILLKFLEQNKIKLEPVKIYSVLIFGFLYFVLFIFSVMCWGKTPGKKILGLQVVGEKGDLLKWRAAFLRETIGKSLFLFGIVTILFTKKRQSLYDMLFHSKVIKYDDRLFNKEKIGKVA
ncbi:MAG: hypothetical protein A2381_18790 [Bdellovibrionales bacterium RIFOXYB1_FULL_37_110]|nr:MAG: hypothetical protein A2181_05345 [Bdellovibrionales bacterium RIFOXYA1_FULL_38_20]OFZ52007.1 MAG: hypothetical protein A2417_05140 [Bdellovibrionales bacterium RIFOXYC1_FULL_37_79]OFZ60585.1 MAG: hypothetical protein A2381_18790 [Bdellovibrionales bacterium RIFOXYB1_FULL_37_110]OFZ61776.1 MAG: hypothetical protein A2577_19710 [Bdellovibrionales bacterium RIFOXYD1_FULL_36_51]